MLKWEMEAMTARQGRYSSTIQQSREMEAMTARQGRYSSGTESEVGESNTYNNVGEGPTIPLEFADTPFEPSSLKKVTSTQDEDSVRWSKQERTPNPKYILNLWVLKLTSHAYSCSTITILVFITSKTDKKKVCLTLETQYPKKTPSIYSPAAFEIMLEYWTTYTIRNTTM
jgi:hypothetical protein